MTEKKRLTDSVISKMQVDKLRDNEIRGLVVIIRSTGKFFYLEFKSPVDGKYKKHPLGKWGEVTTSIARDLARIATGQIAKGEDPQKHKKDKREKLAKQKMSTLGSFLESGYRDITPKKTADKATKTIKNHFKPLLSKPMNEITAVEIRKWQNSYSGKPSGANRITNDLRGVLTKAVQFGLIDCSPMPEVKNLVEDKSQKIRYLTNDEESRLMSALDARQAKQREERLRYIEHCKVRSGKEILQPFENFTDHVKPMVILALNTGLRRGELFNLRVSAIDMEARLLTVFGDEAKSKQTRQIPLNDFAFDTIAVWLQEKDHKEYVFPSPVTGGRLDNIDSAWKTIRALSGLKDLVLHNLRHTFGTRLAHNRVDLVTIKELMGHQSLDITAKYLHTSNELKFNAVAGLANGKRQLF